MFKIIQSHRTENLVEELLKDYQSEQQAIFDPFVVIVPSMVLGDWLDKVIASRAGISTLVMTKFWGQYQWTLMQDVLTHHNQYLLQNDRNAKTLNVPEVAVLSPTVMQWRLFGYLTYYQDAILKDHKHPLHPLLSSLISVPSEEESSDNKHQDDAQRDARLWQLANDLARVFNRYLTHREDWLTLWSTNKPLNVEQLIIEKDRLSERFDKYSRGTPDWLMDHYIELEAAQRYLWVHLFADVHLYRVALEAEFWKALEDNQAGEINKLPKVLRIFTIQQLPQTELDFLKRLSQFMDITLLHYNPSKLFWADIVDKSWLQRQQIINPESVFLRDYGHSLLSRLGKQSRDTFAMLANLSGNDDYLKARVVWQDNFKDNFKDDFDDNDSYELKHNSSQANTSQHKQSKLSNERPSLLRKLQNDVLMLDETATQQATAAQVSKEISEQIELSLELEVDYYADEVLENKRYDKARHWEISSRDNSLSIHSCHSLQRQLEVLRIMIGCWLNEPVNEGEKRRHISDIVVLLPDVERHHALISSIFVNGRGQDGLILPAKVTGVVDSEIRQLWEAITGFYKLLGSDSARFEASEVLDWLMLPPLYESFGLTHEQMSHGCDLLLEAGFIRGFDEAHLQQTLDSNDYDYRFSFAQALDRLALGLVMPEAELSACLYPLEHNEWPNSALPEMSLPLAKVSLNDAPIIEVLCRIYTGLLEHRNDYKQPKKAEDWLSEIEENVIHRYFSEVDQSRSMRAIYNAMNGFKSSLRANRHYKQYSNAESSNLEVEHTLAGVEKLPLKLSFMLDSIEDELESQQVSAEPTGVITFGRFGALRNVPFDLVVMLNMNLSEFPDRDRDNRYDLMKATLSRRGDRVSEDDDNGAFLDALLCARSACWIFYDGQSLTDTHEHLPANPVSELLQFLQGEVQWQVNSLDTLPNDIDPKTENLQRYLPKLIKQWLVTEHPALPFHKSLFEVESTSDQNKVDLQNQSNSLNRKPDKFNSDMSENTSDRTMDETAYETSDELDEMLNEAMRKTKLAQQRQFPPAPLWQAVFDTLSERGSRQQTLRVMQPTKQHYQSIATLLGEGFGKLGSIDNQVIESLAELLHGGSQAIDTVADAKLSSPDYSNKSVLKERILNDSLLKDIFDIQEIDIEGSLLYQVRHPARAFLRTQEVHVIQGQEAISHQEPLFLDSLTAYQINEHLINNLALTSSKQLNEQLPNAQLAEYKSDQDQRLNETELFHQALIYDKIMPAGVSRQTTLLNQQLILSQKCDEFKEQLSHNGIKLEALSDQLDDTNHQFLLTPTKELPIQLYTRKLFETRDIPDLMDLLPRIIKIKGKVPFRSLDDINNSNSEEQDSFNQDANQSYSELSPKYWLNILPNSASPKHLLRFWLSHLYWQVARHTTSEQVALNDGVSIWRFNKSSTQVDHYKNVTAFELPPIVYETAAIELIKWAIFAKLAGLVPMTLLPDFALTYLAKVEKERDSDSNYWPRRSDFSAWLAPGYHSDTVYDTCVQHVVWQYVLRDQEPFDALKDSLTTLSHPLYQPLFDSLHRLNS